jgi:hypothetical protein
LASSEGGKKERHPQMAKDHGARQQKRAAKQKAKRLAKRSLLVRRDSKDPNIRIRGAEKWPIVHALMGAQLWDEGIGHLVLARQRPDGELIFAAYLVDVYCLGVKNALWRAGTRSDFEEVVEHLSQTQKMRAIAPACLAKIVKGAVEYAQSFGFSPHPDYRPASMLLEGIDPATCPERFTFGRDGKPLYFQGPNESPAEAAIVQRIQGWGGRFSMALPGAGTRELPGMLGQLEEVDSLDDDDTE